MDIKEKVAALVRLGNYLANDGLTGSEGPYGESAWQVAKRKATHANGWFTPEFIDLSVQNICQHFLQEELLQNWLLHYPGAGQPGVVKTIGVVAAGNIPLVGFHDWMCAFLSGHRLKIKLSSKDDILMRHIIETMSSFYPGQHTEVAEVLKGCDAYIATGSNNSARYFEYYFSKYPHIIRRNRTSVAVLTGEETAEELSSLADDIMMYFGLGCRNVTKVYVPRDYNFEPLLKALEKYAYLADHHKYKNNYDYNLALLLLNNQFYMSNDNILMQEQESIFSPLSVLHYGYYDDQHDITANLQQHPDVQCLVSRATVMFGKAQEPSLSDYADGVDTMHFLSTL
ncbi:acyl-CoA reductase [Chitinophaga caeni]|uniref:Acyl-CoA reductase n=1 Tax=Chitinophaga caeni TaxID=2029983 RepID=A0A291QW27_9BACT|nr:acyl-CoA reductase [Chitinophaga caeni]ATL48082.1 acyl-CoA reductase [Chitinophaga caeni]